MVCLRKEPGLDMVPLLPEVQDSSHQNWDAPAHTRQRIQRLATGGRAIRKYTESFSRLG